MINNNHGDDTDNDDKHVHDDTGDDDVNCHNVTSGPLGPMGPAGIKF